MDANQHLKLATFNVRGLGEHKKRHAIFHYLNKKLYNVIMLQETDSCKSIENRWQAEWGGQMFFAHRTMAARGVAILVKKGASLKVIKHQANENGRLLLLHVQVNGLDHILVDIYAPNVDDPEFLQRCLDLIDQSNVDQKIMGEISTWCLI